MKLLQTLLIICTLTIGLSFSSSSKALVPPIDIPQCQALKNYRVLCDFNSRVNYTMACHKWASLVAAARQLGPKRFMSILKQQVQQSPGMYQGYMIMFGRDAAKFVTRPDGKERFEHSEHAYVSALLVCGNIQNARN